MSILLYTIVFRNIKKKKFIRNTNTRDSPFLDEIFFFLGLSQFKGRRAGSVFKTWLHILCKNKIG